MLGLRNGSSGLLGRDNRPLDENLPVEDAQPFRAGHIAVVVASHGVHDVYLSFLATLLPMFIVSMGLTKTEAGLLSICQGWPSLLQPFIGHLADRTSLRLFYIVAPAVTAVVLSLLGLAPNFAVLAILLAIGGTSSAALHAVGPAITAKVSGKSLGRGLGFYMVGGELSRAVGPLVVVGTVQALGLRGTSWLMIAGLITTGLLVFWTVDMKGRNAGAKESMTFRAALSILGPMMLPLAGILLTTGFAFSSLSLFLPVFITSEGGSMWLAGGSLSVYFAAGVVGALTGGTLSDRLGRRAVLLVAFLLPPPLMLAFLATSGWVRFPLLVLLGFTALSLTPVLMALIQETLPQNRGMANGVFGAMQFGLRSLVVLGIGAMGDAWGMHTAFAVSAVIPLAGLPLVFLLPGGRGSRDRTAAA